MSQKLNLAYRVMGDHGPVSDFIAIPELPCNVHHVYKGKPFHLVAIEISIVSTLEQERVHVLPGDTLSLNLALENSIKAT